MKFVAQKKDLVSIVDKCALAAAKKSPIQALHCLLLEAMDGRLRVVGNNTHTSIEGSIDVDVATWGSVAVDAKKFAERVKAMPEGGIEVSDENGMTISVASTNQPRRFSFQCLPGAEFPTSPTPLKDTVDVELDAKGLDRIMSYVLPAISDDEGRPNVNCALVEWSRDGVRMVSTDGHRMAKADMIMPPIPKAKSVPPNMLVPKGSFEVLRRLVALEATNADSKVKLCVPMSGPDLFIDVAGTRVSVKLGTAEFPPYNLVIPRDETLDVVVVAPREKLVNVIQAMRLAAAGLLGVVLAVDDTTLTVSASHVDTGSADDAIEVSVERGEGIKVGASAPYLLEAVRAMDSAEVRIGMTDDMSPIVVTPEGDPTMLGIVMPMKI